MCRTRNSYPKQIALGVQIYLLLLNNDNNDKIEQSKWWYKILDIIEAFLDAGDAVKRRKKSNQIYQIKF